MRLLPGADGRALRRALVERLSREGHLRSERVAAAMQAVPRELFVPGVPLEEVYRSSEAIVTKRVEGVGVSSASAPDVVALMLEQLDVRAGHSVLEIGAGTGYNAALLAHIVGPNGRVVTLDIDEDLVATAREHLAEAGYAHVDVRQADGALGLADPGATFDRIILTVASRDIAPAWRNQLARPHGRLVLPLAIRGPQRSVAFLPAGDALVARGPRACSFIPLRGMLAAPTLRVPLGRDDAVSLAVPDERMLPPADTLAQQLQAPHQARATRVQIGTGELRDALHLWLVAHDATVCTVWADPGVNALPDLFGAQDRFRGTLCAVGPDGIALLGWADGPDAGELCVLAPPAAAATAQRLSQLVRAWHATGRPRDADLRIGAYPRVPNDGPGAEPADAVVEERWTRFVLSWLPG